MNITIFDILAGETEYGSQTRSNDDELSLSIRNHLRHLLNTRRGSLSHLPHYGMPDITALFQGLPYTRDTIMYCIRQCVRDFEPRLRQPFVRPRHVDSGEDITQFEIVAETIKGEQVKTLCTLYRNGNIKVETAWEYYHHV